jgi:hypothetical protein
MNRFAARNLTAAFALLLTFSNAWATAYAPIGQLLAATTTSGKPIVRVELQILPPYAGQSACVTNVVPATFFLIDLSTTVGQQQATLAQLFYALGTPVGIDGTGTCANYGGTNLEIVYQIYN